MKKHMIRRTAHHSTCRSNRGWRVVAAAAAVTTLICPQIAIAANTPIADQSVSIAATTKPSAKQQAYNTMQAAKHDLDAKKAQVTQAAKDVQTAQQQVVKATAAQQQVAKDTAYHTSKEGKSAVGFFKSQHTDSGNKAAAILTAKEATHVDIGGEHDATSLENMWDDLIYLNEVNQHVRKEVNLEPVKITDIVLATAMLRADDVRYSFSHDGRRYWYEENLARYPLGYMDPVYAWYLEKPTYEKYKRGEDIGGYEYHHYTNLISQQPSVGAVAVASDLPGMPSVGGANAVATYERCTLGEGMYGCNTDVEKYNYWLNNDGGKYAITLDTIYAVEQYYQLLQNYIASINTASLKLNAANKTLADAKARLASANAKYTEAQKAAKVAQTEYTQAKDAYGNCMNGNCQILMYRLYNPYSGEHFYTADRPERVTLTGLGWHYEGVGWIAPATGDPVYRLYNPYAGDHHYTLSAKERDALKRAGWRYEGIGWHSATASDKGSKPLYREYNPYATTGTHNYTLDANEHHHLISLGWRNEGIAWYAA